MDDHRVQLIIEAFNRTQAAWNELGVQTEKAKAEIVGVNSAAASTGTVLDTAGKKGTQAMKQLDLAATESAERMKRVGLSVASFRDYVESAKGELPALQSKVAALKAPLDAVSTGATAAGTALVETGKKGGAGLQHIHDQASHSTSMLGQMVQMALLMATVMGAQKLAEGGINYNRTLENSKLGIGAIMTSMGIITDQQGNVLQGQEKWNASQSLTVDAQQELQKIGIATAATYEELVQVYQGLEAPSLAAKINFADTLELTGLMTNSVKAMGLPINQIVQEGRDMVAGTIDQNSQLAKSLQITNEDVKMWREKGIVFQEIKKRLEGFTYASKEFEKTWDGAWSNFKDFAQKAIGNGSLPLFDFLKQEMLRFSNDMVDITRDSTGKILDVQVKPEVAAKIRELAEDLKKLIKVLETAVSWGSKMAEPAIWVGVALGIGKVALAIDGMYKTIAAGETLAAGSTLMRLIKNPQLLLAVAAIATTAYAGNRAYDNVQISKRADDIRSSLGPSSPDLNVDQLQGPQLKKVLEKFPTATNEDIVKMIRGGGVRLAAPDISDYYSSPEYKVYVDEKRSKQLLDPGKSPFDIKGPDKESAETKKKRLAAERAASKKANEDAIAEAEMVQRGAFGIIDQSREEDHESNKEWLRKRQLLHEEEKIDDLAWIESQRQFKLSEAMINDDAISKKIDILNAEWEAKSSHYAEGKALDTAYAAYSSQYDKLMLDATKATNAELAANDEARIASAKLKKKTDAETAKSAADLAKAQKTAAYSDAARNLSRVEMDEKSGILSTVEALQKKIEILNDLEAMQQRDLDIMSRNSAEEITAWNSQSQAIEGTRQKLNQYYSDLTQRSPIEGMKRGLRSYADTATNVGAGMESTFTNAFKGMEDALVRFAQTGELNFKDMANSIIADLIRIQIRASITGPLAGALNAGITSFFSGGGSTGGGATPLGLDASTMVAHDGGMILPRFHFGGLASDEVPAILQTRERVLSREQAGLFEKFVNKTEGGGGGNVSVSITNPPGEKNEVASSNVRFDGDQMIVDVILRKLQASPGFRNAMAGGY